METMSVSFTYDGKPVTFDSVDAQDHILRAMREAGTFYERDVLECVRQVLARGGRNGTALDCGAFIGTHSLYFARFCGLKRVLAFEANPATFPTLLKNIAANDLTGIVMPANRALGSSAGNARIIDGTTGNAGSTQVQFGGEGGTPVSTIDVEAQNAGEISLIKIDVEGAELEVLAGGMSVIARQRPVLCVEIHTTEHLQQVLRMLDASRYWIVDCLGWSPTYIIEPTEAGALQRALVNGLWVWRTRFPDSSRRVKGLLRRLGQAFGAGRWDKTAART